MQSRQLGNLIYLNYGKKMKPYQEKSQEKGILDGMENGNCELRFIEDVYI